MKGETTMNAKEFLEEALRYKECPADFAAIYNTFQKYQDIAYMTLLEVKRVFDENDLEYQLAFGTLLGMVRDGGQIPWDYDIDLFIHFEDKKRVMSVLSEKLSNDYYFTCAENSRSCKQFFIRVAPKGFNSDYLHVDIFYYIGMPENKEACNVHAKEIKKYIKSYNYKQRTWSKSLKSNMNLMKNKIIALRYSRSQLISKIDALCSEYNSFSSPKVSNANSYCGLWFYTHEMIGESVNYVNSGIGWKVPSGYLDILRCAYGDFMEYLPIEKRIAEVMSRYNHLIEYCPLDTTEIK